MPQQKRSEISLLLFPNEPAYINPDEEFSICKKDNLIELARLYLDKGYPLPNNNLPFLIKLMFTTGFRMIKKEELQIFYSEIEKGSFDEAIKIFARYFPEYMLNHSYEEAVKILDKRHELCNRFDLLEKIPR